MTGAVADVRKRSLWQLLASYGIGAWIVLQVADTLSSLLGLPLWFGQALLVVLAVGFALLMATGFVQTRAAGESFRDLAGLLTWRNAVRGGLVAASLMVLATVGYLVMRSAGVGPFGTLQARGVLEEQERLILADFEGNVEPTDLARTVTTLLRIDLAQSRAFSVLEPIQLAPVLARMRRDPADPVTYEVALEAARREGIKAIVTGELLQTGSAVVVSARIVATSTGEVLAAVRETAREASDLPESVDRLSAQLRERVGESLRTIQGDPPLEAVTTSSMQSLEKYAQAERANDLGEIQRAIGLLDEAIAGDSTFAMAYRKLGILMSNANVEPERSIEAFTRAYQLRERLTDRERWLAEAAYLSYVTEEPQGSIDRYVTLLESYPTDRIALNNLAIAYTRLGRDRDAADLLLRSIRNGGAPASTFFSAIPVLYALGDTADARRTLEALERTYPDNPVTGNSRFSLLSAVFDYAGAEEGAVRFIEENRGTLGESYARVFLAKLRLVQGRVDEALGGFRAALEGMGDGGDGEIALGAAEALVAGVVGLHYTELPGEAVRSMDRLREVNRVSDLPSDRRDDLQFVGLYALAGAPDRALEIMDDFAEGRESEALAGMGPWQRARGQVALAEGRPEDAIALLRTGREQEPGCALCGLADLGRAFDAVAQPDSALHYFERYMSEPDLERLSNVDIVDFWAVVPRLAELHAERGDVGRARELFTLFLDVTEGSDPAYAPKRVRVRGALQSLPR